MGNDIRLAALVTLLGSMSAANAVPSNDTAKADAHAPEATTQAPPAEWE